MGNSWAEVLVESCPRDSGLVGSCPNGEWSLWAIAGLKSWCKELS